MANKGDALQKNVASEPGFRSASPLLVHNGGEEIAFPCRPLTRRAPVCEDELDPAVFS